MTQVKAHMRKTKKGLAKVRAHLRKQWHWRKARTGNIVAKVWKQIPIQHESWIYEPKDVKSWKIEPYTTQLTIWELQKGKDKGMFVVSRWVQVGKGWGKITHERRFANLKDAKKYLTTLKKELNLVK